MYILYQEMSGLSLFIILSLAWIQSTDSVRSNHTILKWRASSHPSCQYNPVLPNFKAPGRRISEVKCDEYVWERITREKKAKKYKECMATKRKKPYFVIGGRNALPGEYPHMGALGWKAVHGTWIFKCGSSLISPKYALTAAHCSKIPPDPNTISQDPQIVRFGDKDIIGAFTRSRSFADANIVEIIPHPMYSSPSKYYDIALIEIDKELKFTSDLQPACLWNHFDTTILGSKATLTGWGVIDISTRKTSPTLQVAVVDIIDSKQCNRLLQRACNRWWCGIQHQICGGKLAGGVDACQGDSGGPLQVKIPLPPSNEGSMHYIIGVTSFGIGCAQRNVPGIYTRVSSFVDWIESIVWPE